jgi:hypothetical protein
MSKCAHRGRLEAAAEGKRCPSCGGLIYLYRRAPAPVSAAHGGGQALPGASGTRDADSFRRLLNVLPEIVSEAGGLPASGCPEGLFALVCAAQARGFLDGVVLHSLRPVTGDDNSFILTAQVGPEIWMASAPTQWREVRPARAMPDIATAGWVLGRLAAIVADLREDFAREVVARSAAIDDVKLRAR